MIPTSDHRLSPRRTRRYRCRTAEYEARSVLREMAFPVVIRSTDPAFPGSLVAWSPAGVVHVFSVVSTRRAIAGVAEAASLFSGEIADLRGIPRATGASVNLWIRSGHKSWHLYRVFPGGIAETGVPDVA
ncbi:MAG TPA: hypothetical protein PK679_09260 [Methanolinea sp.]|nr:hypothetical protein [Methanolinea sp.]